MMLKGPDSHSDRFLHDLAQINNRIAKAEREISSGRRVNAPSDSPDEISYLLSLRSTLSGTEQSKANLGRVKTEVDTAEQALGHALTVLDRVLELGTQGATGTADASTRRTLSVEVEQLLGQLVNVANAEIGGRFLFSGDTDQVAPYDFDPSQNDAVTAYQGSATTRYIAHPSGSRFPVAKTADTIFKASDPKDDVFGSVNALRNALRDNDAEGVRAALANVRSAAKYLNNQQAFYGGVQNQVTEATDFAEKQIVRVKQQISSVEDADVTAAILDLNSAKQNQEVALAAEARRPQTTLFDYLR
jgi:flagellar hook-associated protein 3 FlgL